MRLANLILIGCLHSGCASKPADPPANQPAEQQKTAPAAAIVERPAERFQLTGSLMTPPAGSLVEVALLLVDPKGRPKDLIASTTLDGTGQALEFALGFSRDQLPTELTAQLRVRVSLSGQLAMRLPDKAIATLQSQNLGVLQLVNAP